MLRSWSESTTLSGASAMAAASIETRCAPILGVSMATPYSVMLCPSARTCAIRLKTGLSDGNISLRSRPARLLALALKNCSAAWFRKATRFAPSFAHLPRPLVAVLVGGANRVYRFNRDAAERLADGLAAMARDSGCGLLVTTSRRTGAANEALLRERLQGLPVEFWDGAGENPYFAYLALADALVVTGDSVNMVSEACFTGKPVYVFNLPGGARSKFGQFHMALAESGATRPFAGRLESWPCTALDERAPLADEIRRRLRNAGAAA